jgi:hypothetical protein
MIAASPEKSIALTNWEAKTLPLGNWLEELLFRTNAA